MKISVLFILNLPISSASSPCWSPWPSKWSNPCNCKAPQHWWGWFDSCASACLLIQVLILWKEITVVPLGALMGYNFLFFVLPSINTLIPFANYFCWESNTFAFVIWTLFSGRVSLATTHTAMDINKPVRQVLRFQSICNGTFHYFFLLIACAFPINLTNMCKIAFHIHLPPDGLTMI